jgi:hypothetical protein
MWKSSQDESFERDFPKLTKERYTLNATSLTLGNQKTSERIVRIFEG